MPPGDLGLTPIAEALKSATSPTGGKSNVIARAPKPCSPGISRARSQIGPGYLATVSVKNPVVSIKLYICTYHAVSILHAGHWPRSRPRTATASRVP